MRKQNRFVMGLMGMLAVLALSASAAMAQVSTIVEKQITTLENATAASWDPGVVDAEDVRVTFSTPKTVSPGVIQVVPTTTAKQESDAKLQQLCFAYRKIALDYYTSLNTRNRDIVLPVLKETLAENPGIAAGTDWQAWVNVLNANFAEHGIDIVAFNAQTQELSKAYWDARQVAYYAALARLRVVPK